MNADASNICLQSYLQKRICLMILVKTEGAKKQNERVNWLERFSIRSDVMETIDVHFVVSLLSLVRALWCLFGES